MKIIAAAAVGLIAISFGAVQNGFGSARDPDLMGDWANVYSPSDVVVGWLGGLHLGDGSRIPSESAVYDHTSKPRLTLLGCEFDIVLNGEDHRVRAASEALAKTVKNGTPTKANGRLINPRPLGVSDPPTALDCNDSSAFSFFLYRHPVGLFGNSGMTAVVLEHANDVSVQAANWAIAADESLSLAKRGEALIGSSKQMYQVQLMSAEAAARAERENEELLGWFVDNGPKLIALAAAL